MSSAFTTIQAATTGGVLTLTLNRPEYYNAYNETMSVELAAALKTAERDDAIRCIVLTGAGKAFCSGQDLQEIRSRYQKPEGKGGGADEVAERQSGGTVPESLDFGAHLRSKYNPLITRIRTLEKPFIAAVNGVAAGAGASFALACDLRIASRSASFMLAFVHVGLIPDSAGALSLLQQVGYARAAELCFLGEKLSAEEAHRWGLVNRVVDDAQLAEAARELGAKLAALPTRAIGLTKRLLNQAWTATLPQQLETEAFLQNTAGHTADHREGVLAFLEKRKPNFVGR